MVKDQTRIKPAYKLRISIHQLLDMEDIIVESDSNCSHYSLKCACVLSSVCLYQTQLFAIYLFCKIQPLRRFWHSTNSDVSDNVADLFSPIICLGPRAYLH